MKGKFISKLGVYTLQYDENAPINRYLVYDTNLNVLIFEADNIADASMKITELYNTYY